MTSAEKTVMLEELLEAEQIKTLQELFDLADTNFVNLHTRLGIKKNMLTRLKGNHRTFGNMEIAKKIANLVGVKTSKLINGMKFGNKNIYLDQMDDLVFEETMGIAQTA